MDNSQKRDSFSYTYSAKQQEEINKIRKKYEEPSEDKMTQIKKLDQSVMRKATSKAIAIGVAGALIMGIGMSLAMTEIGEFLGLTQVASMALGVSVGVVGIAVVCCAYPVYSSTLARERKRVAPEIIRLTDELMK